MDYTGFGKDGRHDYKLDRLLSEDERAGCLDPKKEASSEPSDWLSVIEINSTYLELVDRWYPSRGWAAWQGGMVLAISLAAIVAFLLLALRTNESGAWISFLMVGLVFSFFAWIGFRGMRFDMFRMTHYPVRLNRKTRNVHVTRPGDTVLTVAWEDLFLSVSENDLPLFGKSVDVRAHVLDQDGETVRDTFTLAYHEFSGREELMQLWEYIRRYMEEPDGVEQCHRNVTICMPVDGRREGLAFGIVRVFAMAANQLAVQLVASPVAALTVAGRWLAMSTSEVPVWPEDVENACQVEPDDPYRKDWRSNGRFDFHELGWPVICFVVGLGVVVAGIAWLLSAIM